jgi:HEAT repeat protein
MYKYILSIALLLQVLYSCKSNESIPVNPQVDDAPAALLEEISPTTTYDEIKHLRQRLYSDVAEERLEAAKRLVSMDSGRSIQLIKKALTSGNEEIIKAILIALTTQSKGNSHAGYEAKSQATERFIEPIILLLDKENKSLSPFIYETIRISEPEKAARFLVLSLNQPQKDEIVRCQLVRGLSFVPTKKVIPFLLGLLSTKKTELNTEIQKTLYAITFQTFASKEDWLKWWEENRHQSREQWLNSAILLHQDLLKQKETQIEQLKASVSALRLDLLKIQLEQAKSQNDNAAIIKLLSNALNDESPLMRKYVIDQLKAVDKEPAKQFIPKLVEIISRPSTYKTDIKTEEEIKISIINLLGDIGDEKVITPLITALINSKEQKTRDTIITILGRIGSPSAVPTLLELFTTEPEATVILIIDALRKIKAKDVVPKLHEYLNRQDIQKNENILRELIELLGDLKEPSSAEIIVRHLDDLRKNVRWSAANSLGRMGLAEYAPQIVKLLGDEFPDVRQVAIESLGKLNNKKVIPDLLNSLVTDKDTRVRQLAATALGKFKDASILNELLKVLGDSATDEKVAVAVWGAILAIISDNLELMEDTAQKLESTNKLYNRAVEIYQKIIVHPSLQTEENKPRLMQNNARLGGLYVKLKLYKDAVRYLLDSLKYSTDKIAATFLLVECFKNTEQYDLALKSCQELLPDLKQDSGQWWQLQIERISILQIKKEFQTAIAESKKLLENPSIVPETKKKVEEIKSECENAINPQ